MVPRRSRLRLPAARLVSVGLAVVLTLLVALELATVINAERATERLTRSGDVVDAYLTLHAAGAELEKVEDEYADDPSPAQRERYERAAVEMDASLTTIARLGAADDRALVTDVREKLGAYTAAMQHLFDAVDAGDLEAAEEIDDEQIDPASSLLTGRVNSAGPEHAHRALAEIDALRRDAKIAVPLALALFGVGSAGLVLLLLAQRRLRRRLEVVRTAELGRLERAAHTDSLTGIGNHRAFHEDLERRVAALTPGGPSFTVLMLDLDGLKQVNDAGGHQAGDRRIQAVAKALADVAGETDRVYRVGGDEFAALSTGGSWDGFGAAQRIHHTLGESGIAVTAGIAHAEHGTAREELIRRADLALMHAKRTGQPTVTYAEALDTSAGERDEPALDAQVTLAMALARAVDARDSYTRSHCETVAELCVMIADQLGLDEETIAQVRLAGLVHDVGKIGVPDAILHKPGPLTGEEYETIKEHSALGHRMLSGTELHRQSAWVLHHHERVDGRGYPARLRGEEIPLEARIIHVADAFEAMTSDRPYRDGMADEDARAELLRHAGTQFDAACVAALCDALDVGALASLRRAA